MRIDEENIMANWEGDYDKPLVTVVCNTYNHEKYIGRALRGFLKQKTNFPFEVVVQDDASTDHTAQIIRKYEKKYPHIIRPIYELENLFSKQDGSWRRSLLSHLKGKYLAICEGDDYWTDPRKLQDQVEVMEAHPEYTICFNRVQFVNEDGSPCRYIAPPEKEVKHGVVTLDTYVRETFRNGVWVFQTSCFFLRQEMFIWYDNERKDFAKIFPCGDLPLVLACLMKGNGYYIGRVCGCYRKTDTGATRGAEKENEKERENWRRLNEAVRYFDRITRRKYHDDIMYQIRLGEFKQDVLDRKLLSVLFNKRYRGYIGIRVCIGGLIKIVSGRLFFVLRDKVGRLR